MAAGRRHGAGWQKGLQTVFFGAASLVLLMVVMLIATTQPPTDLFPQDAASQQLWQTCPYCIKTDRYITLESIKAWRLGNEMFGFAAMVGISAANNHSWTPCFPSCALVREIFALTTTPLCERSDLFRYHSHKEKKYSEYDDRTKNLPRDSDIMLQGYYQTWQYFRDNVALVREYFRFQDKVQRQAEETIRNIAESHLKCAGCDPSVELVYIGVHVRRGDMATGKSFTFGYVTAPVSYITNAQEYFREKIANETAVLPPTGSRRKVVFVVSSDDMSWCRSNIAGNDVFLLGGRYPAVDMATLAMCNHTIITVGSFGWWAAWLANGTTTYYSDWPRKDSVLYRMTKKRDYFPPHWIALA